MSNIEGGRSNLTLENLLKLQEVLDCPLSSFFVDVDKSIKADAYGLPVQSKAENLFSLDDLVQALMKMKK